MATGRDTTDPDTPGEPTVRLLVPLNKSLHRQFRHAALVKEMHARVVIRRLVRAFVQNPDIIDR